MLLPFSHFLSHINATRIVLAYAEANGENSSLKGEEECPHSQSGCTLGQFTIRTRNASEQCGSLVGVPTAAGTHFLRDWQRFLFSVILGALEEDSEMGYLQLHMGPDYREHRGCSEQMSAPHPRPCCSFPDRQSWEGMKVRDSSLCCYLTASFFTQSLCLEYFSFAITEKANCFKLDTAKYFVSTHG